MAKKPRYTADPPPIDPDSDALVQWMWQEFQRIADLWVEEPDEEEEENP